MNELEAASSARPLAGRRVRPVDGRVVAAAVIGASAVACVALAPLSLALAAVAPLVIALVGRKLVSRHQDEAVRRINCAHELIVLGDFDGAEKELMPVLERRHTVVITAHALHNLGTASFRRGDVASAVLLYKAALALDRSQKIRALRSGTHVVRASLATALVCAGELDEAERLLAEPLAMLTPSMVAAEILTRAVIALRRDDPKAALAAVEREKVFLRNACAGDGAALALVVEARALEKLGGGYRDGYTPRRVPVDPDERAYILRALPGCESVLIDA